MNTLSVYQGQIKIFLDGADRAAMLDMAGNPVIRGFTTNPSLMKKAGVKDYTSFCKEIIHQLGGKPVSFEVFADEFPEMKKQAQIITSWEQKGASPIYVKIPVVNSKGESSAPLVKELSHQGIKLNVTALYTIPQIMDVCLSLKGGAPSIVSIFAGRIADTGRDPIPTMQAAAEICRSMDPKIELLWASSREALNIAQAEMTGCHIITAPAELVKKLSSFNKDLNEVTLDTVRTFKADAQGAGYTL